MTWLNRDGPSLYFESNGESSSKSNGGRPRAPLVLIPGLTCDGTDWEAQVTHFSASRTVARVDLRGHGRSLGFGVESGAKNGTDGLTDGRYEMERLGDDVVALLEHLDLHNAVIAGHSMGCRVALHVANACSRRAGGSSRVAGVVLVDGSRFATGSAEDALALTRQQIARAGVTTLAKAMFEEMFTERSDPTTAARIVERALRVPPPILEALMEGRSVWDAARMDGALAALNVPLLVLQSTSVNQQGKRVSLAAGDSTPFLSLLRSAVPAASIRIIPDTGHFTMIDAPNETNLHLEQFLAQIEAAL